MSTYMCQHNMKFRAQALFSGVIALYEKKK